MIMKVFLAFFIGAVVALAIVWTVSDQDAKQEVKELGSEIGEGVSDTGHKMKDSIEGVDTTEVKENIKEAGREVAEMTKEVVSDVTITATIKTKFARNPEVSALGIDVDTTDGVVTLSGKVDSLEEMKLAVAIASKVEGVKQVLSTLQFEAPAELTPSTGT
jgi:osmotically-inducible protein OsmY